MSDVAIYVSEVMASMLFCFLATDCMGAKNLGHELLMLGSLKRSRKSDFRLRLQIVSDNWTTAFLILINRFKIVIIYKNFFSYHGFVL